MTISEKYWYTILLTFCRYISVLMIGSGALFILAGYYVSNWFYLGLVVWPLLIMWGVVNFKYVRAMIKANKLEFSKILENTNKESKY